MPGVRSVTRSQLGKQTLDLTPYNGPTTVDNAVERIQALQARLVNTPINPYQLGEEFGFEMGDKRMANPAHLLPLYQSPIQVFFDPQREVNRDYHMFRGKEGQYLSLGIKLGFEMHPWDEDTLRQLRQEASNWPARRRLTHKHWEAIDAPEKTGSRMQNMGERLHEDDIAHAEDVSAYFGMHLAFIGRGEKNEPEAVVCCNPIQTQGMATTLILDGEEMPFLDKLMLGVLDANIGFSKGDVHKQDAREHWRNQARLIRIAKKNIFYPPDKQYASLPIMHYAAHCLGVDTLGYFDYEGKVEKDMYDEYALISRKAVEANNGRHNPSRIVRYNEKLNIARE